MEGQYYNWILSLSGTFLAYTLWNFVSLPISLMVIFIAYFKWTYSYWNRKGVATPTPSIPFGNAGKQLRRKETLAQNIESVYKEFKSKGLKYCGYYLALRPMWIVIDLDLLKSILTKDFEHFMDHGNYINEKNDPLTGQLFMQAGSKWKALRAKLTPTFTSGKMKMMFPTLLNCSRELIVLMNAAADERTAVDIKDIIARFSTDVIGSCAFGIDCNSLKDPNSEFRKYGLMSFRSQSNKFIRPIKSILFACFPGLMDVLKIKIFPDIITQFFLGLVKETVNYREKNGIIRKDFMHLLIQLKNNVAVNNEEHAGDLVLESSQNCANTFSIEEMAAQAFVFFLAGFETSSTTLTFCFYELASNQKLQQRARQEIMEVFKKHNGELTYDALADMVYLEKCINETLRKYPPLPVLTRECTKTYKVPNDDLVIEKGTRVFIPLMAIQRDPEYHSDPEAFDPERFSHESKADRHSFSWLPFGEGPRVCIGQRFGMMQMKVALSTLLKNYKFLINEKTPNPLVFDPHSPVIGIKGSIWLDIEKI